LKEARQPHPIEVSRERPLLMQVARIFDEVIRMMRMRVGDCECCAG